jgi:hypothetical protein
LWFWRGFLAVYRHVVVPVARDADFTSLSGFWRSWRLPFGLLLLLLSRLLWLRRLLCASSSLAWFNVVAFLARY